MLPITRVVLYKHGVGYFEREGTIEGDANLSLTFKQSEVSDVLKSLTVLDLNAGHIASVSYDSTKPLEQLLAEVALAIPDQGSLVSLLPQIKGARVALHTGVADPVEGVILGIDHTERSIGDGIVNITLVSVLTDNGDIRSFDLHNLARLQILDSSMRRDLDFYLKTQLSAKKKDSRTFTFFAQGQGQRTVRLSYTLAAPVWKATYRILLGEEGQGPMIQGWAVVDNTQDEDWENVHLSLVAGLPVSFVHDLYTPRFILRPEVRVEETTGLLPPEMEMGMPVAAVEFQSNMLAAGPAASPQVMRKAMARDAAKDAGRAEKRSSISSMTTQVRERKVGDLFEYEIEHPVTIRRNQSALVPIVLRGFEGRPVLLYNKHNRPENPMRCVEFKNTTGLTLEGGPVTVLEGGSYVGEAMLETLKPDEERLVPYSVELAVHVLDNVESHNEPVHRIVIRKGILKSLFVQVQQTAYTFDNKSDQEQILYLEHPRGGSSWKLLDTADPKEITENYWRFRFPLPAKKAAQFVVKQQQTLHQAYSLADLSDPQFHLWLEQKFLDKKTEKVLSEVVQLRNELATLEYQVKQLGLEREKIFSEQGRIRENLQSLGDRASEKDLRERFVRTLNVQEDRLEAIDKEVQEKSGRRDQLREKIAAVLAKLDFEAEVSS